MTPDAFPGSSGGSPAGAPALSRWERIARLTIGIWIGMPGLFLVIGDAWRLPGVKPGLRAGLISMALLGLVQVVVALLALRGRLGLAGAWLMVSLAFTIPSAASATTREGVPPTSGWTRGAEILFLASALVWIIGRRVARSTGARNPERVAAILMAGAFTLYLPHLAKSTGEGFGAILSPGIVAERVSINQRLPDARVAGLDGAIAPLDERGVVYVVNFWATWCGPCRKELPRLLELSREWEGDSSVRFVAVNTEDLDRNAIEAFLEGAKLSGLPVYTDPEGLEKRLGYGSIPLTMLLLDGKVLSLHSGYSPELMSALSEEIRSALKGSPSAGSSRPSSGS